MEPVRALHLPSGPDWLASVKWDGVRLLTLHKPDGTRLLNRHGRDRQGHYPELLDVGLYCDAESVILDGEVIALGADGRPSFHDVMRRDGLHRLDKVRYVQAVVPISYMVFDVIFLNGEWLHNRTFDERQAILADIIHPTTTVQRVDNQENVAALLDVTRQYGLEGIVVKQRDSLYRFGEKSREWQKIKHYRDVIAVIGGYTYGPSHTVNALMLGLYDKDDHFLYIGHVGSGKLNRTQWRDLTQALGSETMPTNPFQNKVSKAREAVWVRPERTVKVQFLEWTPDKTMRQPTLQACVAQSPHNCRMEDELL